MKERRRASLMIGCGALLCAVAVSGLSCGTNEKGKTEPGAAVTAGEGIGYAEIASEWNERAVLLERVWARAAVSLRWTDEEGRSRYEQGRGHLQLVQPDRFALSIHKLGEVLFWFGADEALYWLIDRNEPRSAQFGRRELLSFDRLDALGMPATPLDLAAMTGALRLPERGGDAAPVVYRSDAAPGAVRFDLEQGWRTMRYHIDPARMVPVRMELIDDAGEVVAYAEQEVYGGVRVEGWGGNLPLFPSRMRVYHPESGATLTLTLEEMSSRSPAGEISDDAFDFAGLLDRFGVERLLDLDAMLEEEGAAADGSGGVGAASGGGD
ncbi:MAG: hypothetical protein ACTS3F_06940 [Phycisphaerales bacterium]